MKNNKRVGIIAIGILFALTGCGGGDKTTESTEMTTASETTEKATQQTEVEATEATEAQTTEQTGISQEDREYQPNKEDGSYYSLLEDGVIINTKTQQSGTCWTNAIASSIESTYYKEHQEEICLDGSDLCLNIYNDDKAEGWFVKGDKMDIGG